MDTRNYNIMPAEVVEELRARKNPSANFFKLIPKEFEQELLSMNRQQRREWYRKNKKLLVNPNG
jgi:hypothetical protein